MYELCIELKKFSAAHRLVKGYQGKCNHLHGHNYALNLIIAASSLDENELVVDFAVIREICDSWIQSTLDHSTLVYEADLPLLSFLETQAQKHYRLGGNTTVEYLARDIYEHLSSLIAQAAQTIPSPVTLHLKQVELWESADCSVIYYGIDPR